MSITGLDAFSRNVYCLHGLPIDAVTMPQVVRQIRLAAENKSRLFLSTPNLNFLIGAQNDAAYRDTVIASDLNIADGMPLIWIARLLGLPIRERVAGSDLLSALATTPVGDGKPLKVMFFGGMDGVGEAACRAVNTTGGDLICTGYVNPGFKSADELGENAILDEVNAIESDFLIVALGARKGQVWLHHNADRLKAPVRSHLGALINMAAGTIRKAPPVLQRAGLEWLWRIREEPALWRRYWKDGLGLIRLLAVRILPLAILLRVHARQSAADPLKVAFIEDAEEGAVLTLHGIATLKDREVIRTAFRGLASGNANVALDFSALKAADPGFFGLLLVLKQYLSAAGRDLQLRSVSPGLRRCFRLNGVLFLLE